MSSSYTERGRINSLGSHVTQDTLDALRKVRTALVEFTTSENATTEKTRMETLSKMLSDPTSRNAVWLLSLGFYNRNSFYPFRFKLGGGYPGTSVEETALFTGYIQQDKHMLRVMLLTRDDLFRFLSVIPDAGYPYSSSGVFLVVYHPSFMPIALAAPDWLAFDFQEDSPTPFSLTTDASSVRFRTGKPRSKREIAVQVADFYRCSVTDMMYHNASLMLR